MWLFVAIFAAIGLAGAAPTSDSKCTEYVANTGYGYGEFLRLDRIGRVDAATGRAEFDFYVQTQQVFQLLLTAEPRWIGGDPAAAPYEIQNYNNQVFMVNRRQRMIAKINRNYILDAARPVPMRLSWQPATGTLELQVRGEQQPFVRIVDAQPIAGIAYVSFGTHGPNQARYLYGCAQEPEDFAVAVGADRSVDQVMPCDGRKTQVVDANAAVTTIALDRLVEAERAADEALALRLNVRLGESQKAVKFYLHSMANLAQSGAPYYEVELSADYTLRRGSLKVATRRPTVDLLLPGGEAVAVNIVVRKDGWVHIWLDDQRSQLLRFAEEYPIELRYVTFEQGLWSYEQCTQAAE